MEGRKLCLLSIATGESDLPSISALVASQNVVSASVTLIEHPQHPNISLPPLLSSSYTAH